MNQIIHCLFVLFLLVFFLLAIINRVYFFFFMSIIFFYHKKNYSALILISILYFFLFSIYSLGPLETLPREMVSRRKILSRSRDDLNLEHQYQQQDDEEDIWYQKDKLYKVSFSFFLLLESKFWLIAFICFIFLSMQNQCKFERKTKYCSRKLI